MPAVSSTDALWLWETGAARWPAERAQMLLAAAHPEAEPAALASLPVGSRNARLLRARAATVGRLLPCEAPCPACGERLEFALDTAALLAEETENQTIVVHHEGETYAFRLPTDADLLAVAGGGTASDLLERCRIGGHRGVPEAVAREAEARMAEADPLALISLDLACPACGHAWQAPLEVADFFFAELAGSARRVLVDVHRLARAYGWRESDVLALSPWRRQQYLALIDG